MKAQYNNSKLTKKTVFTYKSVEKRDNFATGLETAMPTNTVTFIDVLGNLFAK